jgi:hypothetical protein
VWQTCCPWSPCGRRPKKHGQGVFCVIPDDDPRPHPHSTLFSQSQRVSLVFRQVLLELILLSLKGHKPPTSTLSPFASVYFCTVQNTTQDNTRQHKTIWLLTAKHSRLQENSALAKRPGPLPEHHHLDAHLPVLESNPSSGPHVPLNITTRAEASGNREGAVRLDGRWTLKQGLCVVSRCTRESPCARDRFLLPCPR